MRTSFRLSALALALVASAPALAQMPPDAGRILQELSITPEPIAPSTDVRVKAIAPPEDAEPGGPRVELRTLRFDGETRFDAQTLRAVLHDALGKSHDLTGLRNLARRITRYYRERGYPFARAYLPPQRMTDGELLIEVIEGRYGAVSAVGEAALAAQAQPFLSALQAGEVIEGQQLERSALILGDQPGIVLTPVITPGGAVGTGDFEARVSRGPVFEGKLGADNHGNRYSGRHRALAGLSWNSPFMLGDQLSISAMLTDENLWLGQLAYSLPLGAAGLRGQLSYAHTYYELGREFADLDATGSAKIASAGLSYPLIRTRARNLILSAQYQHKELRDEYGLVALSNDKSSDSLPVTLQFDLRDDFGGGAITYGALSWTPGHLSLDSPDLRDQDRLTAETEGDFHKLALDVARLQRLPGKFSLFARFAGQIADKNLDSSEGFSLGGASGVRAYPQGEGAGDEGWLAQVELRWALGGFAPYAFYDVAQISYQTSPWTAGDNRRSISGFGTGARWTHERIGIDATVAWRAHGDEPVSETEDRQPRFWVKLEYTL